MTDKTTEQKGRGWGWVLAGCIVFGVLMGARTEFHSGWAQDFVAGCAFVVLGLSLSRLRRAKP